MLLLSSGKFLDILSETFPEGPAMYSSAQTEFSRLRQQAGLTIRELEASLGYAQRTLQRYETGETSPRAPVLEKLANIARTRSQDAAPQGFRFIDLFAGI